MNNLGFLLFLVSTSKIVTILIITNICFLEMHDTGM